MVEDTLDYTKITSHDLIQKRLIDYAFNMYIRATNKEEPVADFTHQTGFIRGVRLLRGMLLRNTPLPLKKNIDDLYDKLKKELKETDDSNLSEPNKRTTKQRIEDEIAMDVLEILSVVLHSGPSNVELREMEVFTKDIDNIAVRIRTNEKIPLFENKDIDIKASEE